MGGHTLAGGDILPLQSFSIMKSACTVMPVVCTVVDRWAVRFPSPMTPGLQVTSNENAVCVCVEYMCVEGACVGGCVTVTMMKKCACVGV